jgi:hypothetical protein
MEEAVHIDRIDVHDSQCIPETQSREGADREEGRGHGPVLAPAEQQAKAPPTAQAVHGRPPLQCRSAP